MKTAFTHLRWLVLLLVLPSGILQAQNNRADLYRDSIRTTRAPLQLMRLYASLGESLYLSDPDSAYYFFNAGDSVAQLVPAAERNASYYSGYAPLLNNIAFIAQKRGDILHAVHLYQRCLEAHRASGDTSLIGSVYLNLGKLYSEAGEKDLGLIYYGLAKKAIPATEEVGQAYCQNGIGKILFLQGNYESALNCYYSALNLFRRAQHSVGETRTQISIGQLYFVQKLLDASRDCFRQSLALAINDSNLQAQAESYRYLGEIAMRYHQEDSALYFGEKALALSNASGFPMNIRDAASLLYHVYKSKGNTSEALRMHELFSTMSDSLNNVEKSNAVIREKLSADFENRSAQLKAEEEKKTAVATEAARLQRTITYFGAAGLALTVILLVVVYRSYRTKKSAHETISAQKLLVDEKNKNITDSIRYASHLQNALMPDVQALQNHTRDAFIFFRPKDIVSGDFFWSIATSNYLFVAICDSTGHGVPGAFVSVLNMSFIKEAINEKQLSGPAEIFDFVRERLSRSFKDENSQDGMDGVLVRIDLHDISRSTYASANNVPVLIRNGAILSLTGDKMAVGKSLVATHPFREFPLALAKDDVLYVYTDGFADQFGGPAGKKYKYKKLHELLLRASTENCTDISARLETEFREWKGDLEQTDDVLICGIRF